MRKRTHTRLIPILFVISFLSCGQNEPSTKEELNVSTAAPVAEAVASKNIRNEPNAFRGIQFGASLAELKNQYTFTHVKTGYGRLFFEDLSSSETTLAVAQRGGGMTGRSAADPEEHRCITCLSENGRHATVYKIEGDRLRIGDIPLEYIWYHFYQGRLCTVEIRFNDDFFFQMEDILFREYGERDDAEDGSINWHLWRGDNVYIKLWRAPKNPVVKKAFIEYCFLPIQKEDKARYGEALKKWGEDRKKEEAELEAEARKAHKKAVKDL